ncbi:MAG: DPP IV N-terminal domain-containing protein, partial [Myxococcales bacterium]|nr:DPP IV N-terminal domain-containing protein [Myxococcales bacterium]
MRLPYAPAALALLALAACGEKAPAPNPGSTAPPPSSATADATAPAAATPPCAPEKGPRPTAPAPAVEDAHPGFLTAWAETLRFRLGRPKGFHVTKDGSAVLFLRSGPRSFVNDLWQLDVATGEERVVATADLVLGGAAENLTPEEKARRERARMLTKGIATFSLTKDEARLFFPLSGSLYLMERGTGHVTELPAPPGFPIDPRLAPDDSGVACAIDGEVWVLDLPDGTSWRKLTDAGGRPAVTNGVAEFVAQEEMDRMHGFWWSPTADRILYQENDEAAVEEVTIADPMHPEKAAYTSRYPRPGKENAKVRLGLIARAGGDTTWLTWDHERYPYLATVAWRDDGPLTLVVQSRRQDEEAVLVVDPATGATTPIHVEKDDAWLNIDQAVPRWLPGGEAFLWTTERDGDGQIEVRDGEGALVRTLLPPGFGFRRLAAVKDGQALVEASAEPTEQQVYLVDLAGKEPPKQLTDGAGYMSVLAGEPGAWVRGTESLEAAPAVAFVRAGAEPSPIASKQETPPFSPKVEVLALDHARAFRAAIVRPQDFDEARRYPVILSVYGGPHYRIVEKKRDNWIFPQWLADQGYIVVSFDGRGTPGRGRAWERAIKGDLISAPLGDQVEALQAAARHVPQMDLSRVGVTGWSFGGYFAAQAVLQRPDVFTAGVA